MRLKNLLSTLNEYSGLISIVVIIVLAVVAKQQIVINQDLNEVKGKIAEFDVLSTKNFSSDELTITCPEGKDAILTYEDNNMVIRCE